MLAWRYASGLRPQLPVASDLLTRSEFLRAIADEFGDAFGRSLVRDLVVTSLGERTSDEALAAGVSPRVVWLALCSAMDVPRERWYGAGRPEPAAD
jgi:hypothetical protein